MERVGQTAKVFSGNDHHHARSRPFRVVTPCRRRFSEGFMQGSAGMSGHGKSGSSKWAALEIPSALGLGLLYYFYTTHFEGFLMIFGHLLLYTLPITGILLLCMAFLTLRLLARNPLLILLPIIAYFAF
ncbi:hypothetical protein [Thalassococcus sp. BH17M4-6]|uniref:hypothetical protein n=1 Tax=Thalassococcus sp. BH17M4-6 TaxID=3413148 RepID=UPI003BF57034